MHIDKLEIPVVVLTVEDFENMPEDQLERVKNLERKLKQYDAMLHTFITKYGGRPRKHHEKGFIEQYYKIKDQ